MAGDVQARRAASPRRRGDSEAVLLRATQRETLEGVVVVAPDGTVLSWNERFLRLWGLTDELLRSRSDEVARAAVRAQLEDPVLFEEQVAQAYATRAQTYGELRLLDGRVLARYGRPLQDEDGTYFGYAWFTHDITDQARAHDALSASEARHRSLVQALSSEVWSAGPDGGLASDLPTWRARTGQGPQDILGAGWFDAVHPDDRAGAQQAWEQAQSGRTAYEARFRICPVGYDGQARTDDPDAVRTLAVRGVPIERGGRIVEWIGVYVDVTEQVAAERERERLSAAAAAAAEDTRALQEVTAALSSAVTLADVLAVILRQGQARLGADGAGVALRDGDRVRYEMLRGYSADIKAAWAEWPIDEPSPVTHVIRTGESVFVDDIEALPGYAENLRLRAFVEASNEHAWARVPLHTPSGVLGALVFGFEQTRSFSESERNFALALAGQCAQAIERARLYERERSTARLLQRSLLPEALPLLRGVQVGALCQPSHRETEVGGDWYDALVIPDGRLAVAVGDVMGKGVRAASVMGQVRNALRGLVHADPAPAVLLHRLDEVVDYLGDEEELVTVVYALLDPVTGVVEWGSAGHLPMLLLGHAGATYVEGEPSLPLGMGGDRATQTLRLGPGEDLLLFSDGLVENRTRPLTAGLDRLSAEASRLGTGEGRLGVQELCDRLATLLADSADVDDVTLLAVRRTSAPEAPPSLRAGTVLPARATSAGAGRVFADGVLAEWGLTELRDSVLLCVSEVVTNAVVHAGSHAELTLRLSDGVLRVEVRDTGANAIPPAVQLAAESDTHGRGLLLVEALADRWGITDVSDGKVVWFEVPTG